MLTCKSVRERFMFAAAMVVSGLIGSILTGTALAEQGNMVHARQSLHEAYDDLQRATPDKGGHRTNAMGLIQQAIVEVNRGIGYADHHGG